MKYLSNLSLSSKIIEIDSTLISITIKLERKFNPGLNLSVTELTGSLTLQRPEDKEIDHEKSNNKFIEISRYDMTLRNVRNLASLVILNVVTV